MQYILRHFNTPLLKFDVKVNTADPEIDILWVDETNRDLLPINLEVDAKGLVKWLKGRTLPKNRAFVNSFLAKCGLSINRPMDIISVSKGLSLNDVYWITEEGFDGDYEKYNLYQNNFSNILALIAFTGIGSSIRTSLNSSPEFTTNGMLPKCWRRIGGKVYLYKGGTSGASNTGNEPYSEFYASEIAKAMGINAIEYRLSRWKGELCSVCELFTSLDYSFVPMSRFVSGGNIDSARKVYESFGDEFVEAFNEMLIFDAIICNTDRHLGNFGVLVDNRTNTIVKAAPFFDHGNSLFNYAADEDIKDEASFEKYIETLLPRMYDDFIASARAVLDDTTRGKVRKLLNFSIPKNPRYNLPNKRLKLINRQIQKRASMILREE